MSKIEVLVNYIAAYENGIARMLVLKTKDNTTSFPIIIAENEALGLIKEIEHLEIKRPQSHDLMYEIMQQFDISIQSVHIYNLSEGIFYTKIYCSNENKELAIESRASDAIILALKSGSPIYVEDKLLSMVGIVEEDIDDSFEEEDEGELSAQSLSLKSKEELQELLQEAIENEDFEYASLLRDEINKKK